jgi:hypothetical protein
MKEDKQTDYNESNTINVLEKKINNDKPKVSKVILAIFMGLVALIINASIELYFNEKNKSAISNEYVVKTINEINKTFPAIVEEGIRMEKVNYDGKKTIQYKYTLINVLKEDVDIATLKQTKEETRMEVTDNLKNNKEIQPLKSDQFNFEYTYYDKNNELLFAIEIMPEDYNN